MQNKWNVKPRFSNCFKLMEGTAKIKYNTRRFSVILDLSCYFTNLYYETN